MGHSTIRLTLDRYGHLFAGSDELVADQLDRVYLEASGAHS